MGLAVDIGTSSITAVVFTAPNCLPTSKPCIKNVYRASLDMPRKPRAETLERQITTQLRDLLKTIRASLKKNPDFAYVGLSAPFYISRLITLTSTRPKASAPITKEEILTLIKKGEKSFTEEYISPKENLKLHLFGSTLLKTIINGYRIPEIVGATGKTLTLFVRYETTAKKYINELYDLFAPLVSEKKLHITSLPTACFYAIGSAIPFKEGLVHVDIGGEISEISIIYDDVLEKIITIPLGNASLARKVSEYFNVSFKEGESLLRQFSKEVLDSKKSENIAAITNHHVREWCVALSAALTTYAKENDIPSNIVLSGGGAFLKAYRQSFSSELLHKTHTSETPHITIADPKLFQNEFSAMSTLTGPRDFGVTCLALLCSRNIL